MGIVAREARERAVAVAETSRAVQIRRFVAHIPGIAPVCIVVQIARLAVARAAQDINLHRRQPGRVLNRTSAAGFGVLAPGSVARFAMDAGLTWLHLKIRGERYRACRVATKTLQNRGDWIERAIHPIR